MIFKIYSILIQYHLEHDSCATVLIHQKATDQSDELSSAFRQFDPDKEGNISASEIEEILRRDPMIDVRELEEFLGFGNFFISGNS